MPTYNKPGVYVEEPISPLTPIVSNNSQTTAVFIGVTDRGPTTTVSGSKVGVATPIYSWNDYLNSFVYGSYNDAFSATLPSSTANIRYAVDSFFSNGGNQAYVLRHPNTGDISGSFALKALSTTSVTTTGVVGTVTVNTTSISVILQTAQSIISTGSVVSISGITTTETAVAIVNNASWYVSGISGTTSPQTVTLAYSGASAPAVVLTSTTVAYPAAATAAPGVIIEAKDPGAWSNNLFVKAEKSNLGAKYFNLSVYYNPNSTSPSAVTDTYFLQQIPNLTLDPNDAQYAPNKVNSNWIKVTATNSSAVATAATLELMPTFTQNTSTFKLTAGPVNIGNATSAAYIVSTATQPQLTTVATSVTGTTLAAVSSLTSQLDGVVGPLVINYPKADADTVGALVNYAATRGDAFVVIDATSATPFSSAQTDAENVVSKITAASGASYGAVYYPYVTVPDKGSKSGGTKDIPPGAAVVAAYLLTDAQRGIYKAPAGAGAKIGQALTTTYSLSEAEFTANSTSKPWQLNIIRYVPGSGWCVMGARTLSSSLYDNYVPVRRMLGYLRRSLTSLTDPYLFEPNSQITWDSVRSAVDAFLYSVWQKNGLYGNTPEGAYYVKCDSTLNDATAIQNGELRVEVGVALLKPAEFIVIKLGQFQGGTTITTSV